MPGPPSLGGKQQASGSAASTQHIGSLLAAAAATAAAGAAAAWYWRSCQRMPHAAQRSASAPAEVAGIAEPSQIKTSTAQTALKRDSDVGGTMTPPLRADLAAKLATDSASWVNITCAHQGHTDQSAESAITVLLTVGSSHACYHDVAPSLRPQ
jgi:hypothetical protein